MVHDKTYQKGGWYKRYSDKPYSHSIHKSVLVSFVISFAILTILQTVIPALNLSRPNVAQAGSNTKTWTTNGDFAYNKTSFCNQTTHPQISISGTEYNDAACSTAASDSSVGLIAEGSVNPNTITVGSLPKGIATNPITNKIYIVRAGTVLVIDGSSNTVTATVNVGTAPYGVAVNSVTNKIYVANTNSNSVSVINGVNNTVEATITVGNMPAGIAVNSNTNKIYVTNSASSSSATVSVIDGTNNTVTATVTVGGYPEAVAVNDTTNKIYVANYNSNSVSVIDGTNNTVTATVTVGTNPRGVAINTTSDMVYATNYGSASVSIINGANNTVVATVSVGTNPYGIGFSENLKKIYVANYGSSSVSVISSVTNAITNTQTVGTNPFGVSINDIAQKFYVSNYSSGSVSVIDGTNNSVTSSTNVGTNPYGIAVNSSTNKIYVANYSGNTVSVINGASNTLLTTVNVGTNPRSITVNHITNKIYVTNYGSATMSVIDGATDTVSATINLGLGAVIAAVNPVTNKIYITGSSDYVTVVNGANNNASAFPSVGGGPYGIAVNSDTNKIYVANKTGGSISVINGATDTVSATVTGGSQPFAIAANATTNKVYVTNYNTNVVQVIEGTTNAISATISVGTTPYGIAVNPITNKIYVTNNGGSSLSIINGANNAVTNTEPVGAGPRGVAINSATNQAYVTNYNVNSVSVINKTPTYTSPGTISGLKIDAGSNQKAGWSSISWNSVSLPANTGISFKARTSDDNTTWSAWSADFTQNSLGSTTGSGVLSGLASSRYLDIVMTLTSSDGVSTPTLNDFSVTYDSLESPNNSNLILTNGATNLKNSSGATITGGMPGAWINATTIRVTANGLTCTNCGTAATNLRPEVEIKTIGTAFTGTGTVTATEGVTYADVPGLTEGTSYHIQVRAVDSQGRASGWTPYGANAESEADFTIDQTTPTGTVSINSGVASTNTTNVTLTSSASDTGGSNLSQMRFSNDGTTWSDWETYNASKSWTLTSGDGTKNVYAQYRDNAGNVTGKVFTSQADWQAGTISNLNATSTPGDLKISGPAAVDIGSGAQGDVSISGTHDINEYIANYNPGNGTIPNFNNLTIASDGILTTSVGVILEFRVKGTLTIATGGKIDASAKGHVQGTGPGYSSSLCPVGGGGYGGAGRGEYGFQGTPCNSPTYSYASDPLGSGGWRGGYSPNPGTGMVGGNGGGAVKIWSNNFSFSGSIIANGGNGQTPTDGLGGSGGSGGSIYIGAVNTTSSTGVLSANGGNGASGVSNYPGGGGGGGRILVQSNTYNYTATVNGGSPGGCYNFYCAGAGQANPTTIETITPFYLSGTLGETGTSLSYDSGSGVIQKWTSFSWAAETLASGQSIKFMLSDDGSNWKGPDGNAGNWSTNYFGQTFGGSINSAIPSSLVPSRYIYVKAKMESSGTNTPVLHDISIQSAALDSILLDATTPTVSSFSVESATGNTEYVTEDNKVVTSKGIYYDGGNTANLKVQYSQDGTSWGVYSGSGSTNNKSTDWTYYSTITPHQTNLQTVAGAWYLEGTDGQKTIYVRAADDAGNTRGFWSHQVADFNNGTKTGFAVNINGLKLDGASNWYFGVINNLAVIKSQDTTRYSPTAPCNIGRNGTLAEYQAMYQNRASLGDNFIINLQFTQNMYWTATPVPNSGQYYGIDMSTGNSYGQDSYYVLPVRCVIDAPGNSMTGTYTSTVIDRGTSVNETNISWTADIPAEVGSNSVRFQVASNNDNATWNYAGPDGTANTYYTTSDVAIHSSNNGNRYLKYKLYLQTANNNFTPTVTNVSFGSQNVTDAITLDTTVPTAITSFTASQNDPTNINLSWSYSQAGSNISNYQIERVKKTIYEQGGLTPTGDWSAALGYTLIDCGTNSSLIETPAGLATNGCTLTTGSAIEQAVSYYYRIRAKDLAHPGTWGSWPTNVTKGLTIDTLDPSVFSGVVAEACDGTLNKCSNVNNKGYEIKIRWNATTDTGSGVTGYKVYRKAETYSATAGDYALVGYVDINPAKNQVVAPENPEITFYDNDTNNNATFTDATIGAIKSQATATLNDYVDYFYRITAIDENLNESDVIGVEPGNPLNMAYNSATAKTADVTNPSTPGSLAATATGIDEGGVTQGVYITWSTSSDTRTQGRVPTGNGSGIQKYELYQASDAQGSGETKIYEGANISYTKTGLSEDTYYYYRVRAIDNVSLSSSYSSYTNARTRNSNIPSTPANVSVNAVTGDPNTNANVGYKINIRFEPSKIKGTGNKITGYKVFRSTQNDLSEAQWKAMTPVFTVSDLNVVSGSTEIRDQGDNTCPIVNGQSYYNRCFTDTVPSDATTYFYKVMPIGWNESNQTTTDNDVAVSSISPGTIHVGWDTTPDATKPQQPAEVTVKDIHANDSMVRNIITWQMISSPQRNGSSDFARYEVWRFETNLGEPSAVKIAEKTLLGDNYHVDGITLSEKDKDYSYYVLAVDNAGTDYKYSEPNQGTVINNVSNRSTFQTPVSINPGAAKPTVSSINHSNVGVSTATVTWGTNQLADSLVEYRVKGTDTVIAAGKDRTSPVSSHSVNLVGLEKGKVYEYRVVSRNYLGNIDAAAATNWREFTTQDFAISNIGAETTTTTATIKWNTNIAADSSTEYRPENSNEASQTAGDPELLTAHEVVIKALKPATTYTYKIRSVTSDKFIADTQFATFTTKPFDSTQFVMSPSASNIAEQNITATSAKIVWNTAIATTTWVDYSTIPGVYAQSTGDNDYNTVHVVELKNLTPGTTYYYRVRGKDQGEVEYTSQEYSFKAVLKPQVSAVSVKDVGPYSATITWETNVATDTAIDFGKDGTYGQREGRSESVKSHSIKLEDLEDNNTYHYRIVVRDSLGNEASTEDKTFATPMDKEGAKIDKVKIDILPLGESDEYAQAIISWTTNKPATTKIEYDEGVLGGKYSKSSIEDSSLNNSHTVIIKDLNPASTYHFRIVSKDKRANASNSQDYTFVTPTKEKSILQLIIKSLEETFSWTRNVGSFFKNLGKKTK